MFCACGCGLALNRTKVKAAKRARGYANTGPVIAYYDKTHRRRMYERRRYRREAQAREELRQLRAERNSKS